MGKQRYGALRGRVVASAEERNDHTSPHYQILVMADGEPWRIAVNVKSTDKGGSGPDRSILLYRIVDDSAIRFCRPSSNSTKALTRSQAVLGMAV
jgi:uncharacterized protein YukJ